MGGAARQLEVAVVDARLNLLAGTARAVPESADQAARQAV
jgi:hypothetical protein